MVSYIANQMMLLLKTSIISAKTVLTDPVQEDYVNRRMTIPPRDDNDPQL